MASSGLDVRWPGNSTPAGCMLKVALLDHRKYATEEEAVLRAAERFTAKQDEFYCVFIGLKPIARRLAPPARKAMKVSRVQKIMRRFTGDNLYKDRRANSTVVVHTSLIAIACGRLGSGSFLLTTAMPELLVLTGVKQVMESMVEYIQLCVQAYFKAAQIEVSCYGHSFQSKELAVCVLALNGGSVGDVTDIRIALATLAPSPIPLVIVHVPSAGQPHISVGDLAMEHCVMWEAQTEAGLHCLNLYLGETFGIFQGSGQRSGIGVSLRKMVVTKRKVELSESKPRVMENKSINVAEAWYNMVRRSLDARNKAVATQAASVREEKVQKQIAQENATAAERKARTRRAKAESAVVHPRISQSEGGRQIDPVVENENNGDESVKDQKIDIKRISQEEQKERIDESTIEGHMQASEEKGVRLVQLVKPSEPEKERVKKSRNAAKMNRNRQRASDEAEARLGNEFLQFAANIQATLMTGQLKHSVVKPPAKLERGIGAAVP